MFITFKRHRYLLISIFSFISIIFYELSIDITNLFPKLMANVKSFAVMENNGKVVFLDSKTKFIINNDPRAENLVYNFKYIDYDKKLLNGQIDLKSINNIRWKRKSLKYYRILSKIYQQAVSNCPPYNG